MTTKYPPAIETPFQELPSDPRERHELFVDAFGNYLFWAMDRALEKSRNLVDSEEARTKLGRVVAKPYEEAAKELNLAQRVVAFSLAQQTVDSFAKNLLMILESRGIMLKLGPEHAVVFRLVAEVRDIEHMEIAIEEVVNRDGKKAFASYWGRWLNQRSAERGSD